MLKRAVTLLVLAAVSAVATTSVAQGYTRADATQAAQIRQALENWWAAHRTQCLGSDTFEVTGAVISTANPSYGQGTVADNSCTYKFALFVKRVPATATSWTVIGAYPDSAQECSYFQSFLPNNVIADFGIKGITSNDSGMQPCARTSPAKPAPCAPPASSSADGAILLAPVDQVLPLGQNTTLYLTPLANSMPAGTEATYRVVCGPNRSTVAGTATISQHTSLGGNQAVISYHDTSPTPGTDTVAVTVGLPEHRSVAVTSVTWDRPAPTCAPLLPGLFAALDCSAAAKFLNSIWEGAKCAVGVGTFFVAGAEFAKIFEAADTVAAGEQAAKDAGASSSIGKLAADLRNLKGGPVTLAKVKQTYGDVKSVKAFLTGTWALLTDVRDDAGVQQVALDIAQLTGLEPCVAILASTTTTSTTYGGQGSITPQGQIGPLKLRESTRQDVISFAGTPQRTGNGEASDISALGYGCSNTQAIALIGPYVSCQTAFYIDTTTGRLIEFATQSPNYAALGTIHVGTSTSKAEELSHQPAVAGCVNALTLEYGHFGAPGGNALTLMITGGQRGTVQQTGPEGERYLPVQGGQIGAIVLDGGAGVFDCA